MGEYIAPLSIDAVLNSCQRNLSLTFAEKPGVRPSLWEDIYSGNSTSALW